MRCFFSLLGTLLVPALAMAHALGAECTLEANVVRIEAYYDDDTAAAGATIRVLDAADRSIADGSTDDKGRWRFPRPPAGVYRIDIDAGAGHRRRISLRVPGDNDQTRLTEQPSRQEFTRFRWPELAAGLAMIAVGAIGLRWLLRRRATQSGQPTPPDAPSGA